ncbi:ASCH domain-containing protein [Oerskovia flava]|uniref:ASCH domain-containing protein n=1 Tax=Oerskovia flava TaxID=2986422 RepID=UPI00223FA6FC|nr:ASCH domain-containing protein [Oerskovia sp. JB1-3-2]
MSHDEPQPDLPGDDDPLAAEILEFWEVARGRAGLGKVDVVTGGSAASRVPPPAWSFGDEPQLADRLLAAVLSGAKTATSSAQWEYGDGAPVPVPGELAILLDGAGHPRALIRTASVEVVPFDQVGADFAAAEGEGGGSLEEWRAEHHEYFARTLVGREPADDMPVVCERFELLYPR